MRVERMIRIIKFKAGGYRADMYKNFEFHTGRLLGRIRYFVQISKKRKARYVTTIHTDFTFLGYCTKILRVLMSLQIEFEPT